MSNKPRFAVGDHVIYRMQKVSSTPGPRAQEVKPAAHGEEYVYEVEKYWTVTEVNEDGRIVVVTRRGKSHTLRSDDPLLEPAGLKDRLFKKDRFPPQPDA